MAICLSTLVDATLLLTHLYTECGPTKHKVSKDLWTKIKVYKADFRHTSARENKDLGLSTVEKKHTCRLRRTASLRRSSSRARSPTTSKYVHTFLRA